MNYKNKTKKELIAELNQLHTRLNNMQTQLNTLEAAQETIDIITQKTEKYRFLFEESKDSLFITNANGYFIEVNQAALDMLGYTKAEMLALPTWKFYAHRSGENNLLKAMGNSNSVKNFETQLLKKDGSVVDCLMAVTCQLDKTGHPIGFYGIARDITMYKHTEKALKKAHNELEQRVAEKTAELEAVRQANLSVINSLELSQVLENIIQAIISLVPNGDAHIFLYNNNRLEFGAALLANGERGKPIAEPRSDGLTYTVAKQGEYLVINNMQTHPFYINTPYAYNRAIVGLPLKIGQRVVGVTTLSRPEPFSEEKLYTLRLLTDHAAIAVDNARLYKEIAEHSTELSKTIKNLKATQQALETARQEAEAASKAKSSFLANMSHELRTPLNVIIGFTRLVKRQVKADLPQKHSDNLGKVLQSAEHLLGLINNILDISKIEAEQMDIHITQFNINTIIEICLQTVKPLMRNKKINLIKNIEPNIPLIVTDRDKLKQILINLLSNAIKFTAKGTITVTAQHKDKMLILDVTDTGIGISTEALEYIFDEFQQVDSSSTRQYGGSGLGLPISRHLTRLLKGDLTVESTLEVGSTFTVSLPLTYKN